MRILLLFATLVFSVNCTGGPEAAAPDKDAAVVARSPGKPLHPIQVRAVVDGPLQAGVESAARLVVTTSRPADAVEVELQPQLATVISANRFERRNDALRRGAPVDFAFRFRPASDEPQPLKVLVRVTGTDGRVLTREVTLPLGGDGKPARPAGKPRVEIIDEVPEAGGDVVLPAEQEMKRGK